MQINLFTMTRVCLAIVLFSSLAACDRNANLSAEQYIERAKDLQSKGDARSSILELKNAVQKDPENAQARWLLGSAYLELRLGAEAETQFEKAIQLGISPQSVRVPLARAQLYQGHFQQLLDKLSVAETDEPGIQTQVLDLRGNALTGLGKFTEGCPLFERALQTDQGYAPAYLGRARCQFRAGELNASVESAKQATKLDPVRLESWYFLGDLYRAINRPNEALAAYNQALKVKPDDFDAIAFRAITLLSLKRMKEAQADISRMNTMRPQALLSKYLRAYINHYEGKNNDASSLIQQVLKESPNNPQFNLLYGSINYALKNDEIALSSFNKALAVGELAEARILLGATYLRMGNNAAVIKTLTPMLTQGNNAKAFLLAGQAALNLGELERGMDYLSRGSSLDPNDPMISSALAQNQVLTGDQQGISGLESVITANPSDTRAFLLLAAVQAQKGDFKGGLATLQKMAASQPTNPLTHVLIGRIYLMQRNPAAARQAFEKSLAIKPDFILAAGALADLDIQEKKPAQARERFKTILAKTPNNLSALMEQARVSLAMGESNEFVSYLKQAIDAHPSTLQPTQQLTMYYINTARQPDLALAIAQKSAKINSGNPGFMSNLGQAQLSAGRKKDAVTTYTNLVNLQPNSPLAWYYLGWAQRVSGNIDGAVDSMQKAIRIAPSYLDAHIGLAGLYAASGQQDGALKEARAIQALNPRAATGYNLEAELSARFKKPDASLQALALAQQNVPSSETTSTYHLALVRSGKEKQAEQVAQQWLKLNPADSNFRIYLAGVYAQKRLNDQAVAQYKLALNTSPDNVKALNNLAVILQEQNNPAALEYAQRAYALMPTSPVVMDTYGWSLFLRGKAQEAAPLLTQSAKAMPNAPGIQFHLASVLAQTGRQAEALSLLRKTLVGNPTFAERDRALSLSKTLEANTAR